MMEVNKQQRKLTFYFKIKMGMPVLSLKQKTLK